MSLNTCSERPALELLSRSPLPALRGLTVSETPREVVITGSVSTYYLKQLAQETVRAAVSGRQLLNRVTVRAAI